ncbi:MAG: biopolymer transporter ExbD [Kofleriaceae bacterium]|nr:biopolymer transporter ExbD [Kofleriaceae bacterium]
MRAFAIGVLAVAGCGSKGAETTKVADEGKQVNLERVEAKAPPPPPRTAARSGDPACETFAIAVVADGIWLGTRPDGRCFAPRKGAALDTEWLSSALSSALASKDCMAGKVVVSGFAGVKYQDIVSVMDTAVQVGLRDVSIAGMDELPMTFTTDPATAAKDCPSPVLAVSPPPAKPPRPRSPSITPGDAVGGDTVPNAVIVAVSTEEILVNGKVVGRTAEVATGSGTFKPLVEALPKGETDRVIVQADQKTDMKVMVRVLETLKQAGFADVALAVKSN